MATAALARNANDDDLALEFAALEEAGGDIDQAVELLSARVLADPEFVRSHLGEWCKLWSRHKVGRAVRSWREKIVRRAENPGNFAAHLQTAMTNEYHRLMDMPLYGGKRLGDATPSEIRESADRYQAASNDMGRKARWQNMVADAAEKNGDAFTPIKSSLSEATLTRLWSESDAA